MSVDSCWPSAGGACWAPYGWTSWADTDTTDLDPKGARRARGRGLVSAALASTRWPHLAPCRLRTEGRDEHRGALLSGPGAARSCTPLFSEQSPLLCSQLPWDPCLHAACVWAVLSRGSLGLRTPRISGAPLVWTLAVPRGEHLTVPLLCGWPVPGSMARCTAVQVMARCSRELAPRPAAADGVPAPMPGSWRTWMPPVLLAARGASTHPGHSCVHRLLPGSA